MDEKCNLIHEMVFSRDLYFCSLLFSVVYKTWALNGIFFFYAMYTYVYNSELTYTQRNCVPMQKYEMAANVRNNGAHCYSNI